MYYEACGERIDVIDVREEVEKNIRILSQGGGFVFSVVHNLQANVPTENIKAVFEAFEHYRNYVDTY